MKTATILLLSLLPCSALEATHFSFPCKGAPTELPGLLCTQGNYNQILINDESKTFDIYRVDVEVVSEAGSRIVTVFQSRLPIFVGTIAAFYTLPGETVKSFTVSAAVIIRVEGFKGENQ
jgi:hypothetical protein